MSGTARCSVLVVDDDRTTRFAVGELFASHGFAVATAVDGAEALDAIVSRRCRPHVIVLDFKMPRMDGAVFSRALVALGESADMAIIGATAFGRDVPEEFLKACAAVVEKPFDPDALVASVRAHCRTAHA